MLLQRITSSFRQCTNGPAHRLVCNLDKPAQDSQHVGLSVLELDSNAPVDHFIELQFLVIR